MSLRMGVVVATHPEDHSVDLVMVDDNSRLTGVQVMTSNGSSRSGSIDLPAVPEKKDKWDISRRNGQDQIAIVGYLNRHPIVTGFLYPQINQMTFKDPKMRFDRHQSDVMSMIDGDGNMQLMHPSGAYIRIGETPDSVDIASKNADASLKPDRNTGRKVDIRVALAGNVVKLTMTKDGNVTLEMEKDLDIQVKGKANINVKGETTVTSEGDATVKAPLVTLDTPETHCTGNLTVDGGLLFKGGGVGSGGNGATLQLTGDLAVTGNGNFGGSGVDGDGDGGA